MNHAAPPRLELGHLTPLAAGSYRSVFQHPNDENLLVKVLREKENYKPEPWYKAWRGSGEYKSFSREVAEYKSLRRKNLHDLSFIQRFFGKVDTDLGLGMIVEKLLGPDGRLAPTVKQLVLREGLSDRMRAMLFELRDQVIEHNIIFSDIKGSNIVFAHDRRGGRLVVIDGLGDRLWLPVNSMSAMVNRLNRQRHFERAIAALEELSAARG